MASFDAHKNLAVSTIAVAPDPAASGTSLTVAPGEGARFPAVPFNATVWPDGDLATPLTAEIIRVTAITGDALTITRAQEGTTARTIGAGDLIAATITVKTLTDIETAPVFAGPAVGQVLVSQGVGVPGAWSENLRLGVGAVGTSGNRVLALGGGTAPTTSPVDTVQLWAQDIVPETGSHGLHMRDERGGTFVWGTVAGPYPVFRMGEPSGQRFQLFIGAGEVGLGAMGNIPLTFRTQDTGRWTITAAGHLLPAADATYDIGSYPSTRVRLLSTSGRIDAGELVSRGGLYVANVNANTCVPFISGNWFAQSGNLTFDGWTLVTTSFATRTSGDANVVIHATTGHQYTLLTTGSGSGWGAGSFVIYNNTLNRTMLQWDSGGLFYLATSALSARAISTSAPDAAGAGWRYLRIQN